MSDHSESEVRALEPAAGLQSTPSPVAGWASANGLSGGAFPAAPAQAAPAAEQGIAGLRRTVAVIGLGYTGLPLAGAFVAAGRAVLGFDIDAGRRACLARGQSPLPHLDPSQWQRGPGLARLWLPEQLSQVRMAEAVFLCLPTPLGPGDRPDLSAIEAAARELAPHLSSDQLVILTSTSFPGTLRQHLCGWLSVAGQRPALAYSPEREDPGSGRPARSVPRLVAGLDAATTRRAAALLREAIDTVIEVESPEIAEAAKLFENAFRAVNIALANELKRMLLPLGLDPHAVIAAAASKPFGFLPFAPGPGAGGHCIPVDPHYLQYSGRQVGEESALIAAALDANRAMPAWVAERLRAALSARGKACAGARILLVGVAYKAGVADLREAPALDLWQLLEDSGAEVCYHDPYLPRLGPDAGQRCGRESNALEPGLLATLDAVVILTAHPGIPWRLLVEQAPLIIDTRGVLRELAGDPRYVPA
jgi:UDP-N-acetyl-D-glucosamine dehydrogenase